MGTTSVETVTRKLNPTPEDLAAVCAILGLDPNRTATIRLAWDSSVAVISTTHE